MARLGATSAFIVGIVLGVLLHQRWIDTSATPADERPAATRELVPQNRSVAAKVPGPAAHQQPETDGSSSPQTIDEILRIRGEFTQTAALYRLGGEVDRDGLEALIDEANRLKQVGQRDAALFILYSRYAELDPREAVEHVLEASRSAPTAPIRAIFQTWARMDLDGAIEYVSNLTPGVQDLARLAILEAQGDLSLADRKMLAGRLGLPPAVAMTVTRPLEAQLSLDPPADWEQALTIQDRQQRFRRLAILARQWGRSDPRAALAAAELLDEQDIGQAVTSQIVRAWAESDAAAALEWVLQYPFPGRDNLLLATLGAMAVNEPRRAVEMAVRLDSDGRNSVLVNVIGQWVRRDPEAVAQWVRNVTDPSVREAAVTMIASAYGLRDSDAAIAWARTLPPEESVRALAMSIGQIARSDPQRAAELATSFEDPATRSALAVQVASGWAQKDPEAALTWVDRLADDDVRQQALPDIIGHLARTDLQGAVRLLNELETGSQRDMATLSLIGAVSRTRNSALVNTLYEEIESPVIRSQAAQLLYHTWQHRDPVFAEQFRSAAGLRAGDVIEGRSVETVVIAR